MSITVRSLLEPDQDPTAFRDIKEVEKTSAMRPRENRAKWFTVGGAALIVLGLSGLWWWRRDRKIDPTRQAEEAISAIELQVVSKQISTGDAYDATSAVLRNLIERTLGFPASAMSTEELRRALAERSFPPATIQAIDRFLTEADVMKFSGSGSAGDSETGFVVTPVRNLVREISEGALASERGN
jgi:hypothetical protein